MTLPDVVYLDQLRDGLAFLDTPLHLFTEITIRPDSVTLVRVSDWDGRPLPKFMADGRVIPGEWDMVTHEIPLRSRAQEAAA